jgi:hypothetical protein
MYESCRHRRCPTLGDSFHCATCHNTFRALAAYDAHHLWGQDGRPACLDPAVLGLVLREDGRWVITSGGTLDDPPGITWRRTATVTITNMATSHADTVRLCDPGCRDVVLLDLGLKGSGGGSAFPSHGQAEVFAEWNGEDYEVAWKRGRPTRLPCDLCGGDWMTRPVRAKRERTAAQVAAAAANLTHKPPVPVRSGPRRSP